YRNQYQHQQTLTIRFADLLAHTDDIRVCMPRIATTETYANDTWLMTTEPIRWTPFVRLPAVFLLHLRTASEVVHWPARDAPQSNVTLSGVAEAAPDGRTRIDFTADIAIAILPPANVFSELVIRRCIDQWRDTLIGEFCTQWHQLHPEIPS